MSRILKLDMWFLNIKVMKIMEFYLKWVHTARYELILRLDGALWLRIISKPLLTQIWFSKIPKWPQNLKTSWGRPRIILFEVFFRGPIGSPCWAYWYRYMHAHSELTLLSDLP